MPYSNTRTHARTYIGCVCLQHVCPLSFQIIQGLQLFTNVDRRTVEVVSLYLVAFEALLLPHTLWLLSRRYRHALTYQWNVYVLRNKDLEEDGTYINFV